jgi:heat shock protein HslJ
MKKLVITLPKILAMFFLSCSSSKEDADIRLHDIWALESIKEEKIILDETIKNLPVLEIYVAEERFHGNTGCNTLDGKVNIDEDKISFEGIVKTEMACPGNLEQNFITNLNKVNKYKIEKMRLYLFDEEKELLVFKKID